MSQSLPSSWAPWRRPKPHIQLPPADPNKTDEENFLDIADLCLIQTSNKSNACSCSPDVHLIPKSADPALTKGPENLVLSIGPPDDNILDFVEWYVHKDLVETDSSEFRLQELGIHSRAFKKEVEHERMDRAFLFFEDDPAVVDAWVSVLYTGTYDAEKLSNGELLYASVVDADQLAAHQNALAEKTRRFVQKQGNPQKFEQTRRFDPNPSREFTFHLALLRFALNIESPLLRDTVLNTFHRIFLSPDGKSAAFLFYLVVEMYDHGFANSHTYEILQKLVRGAVLRNRQAWYPEGGPPNPYWLAALKVHDTQLKEGQEGWRGQFVKEWDECYGRERLADQERQRIRHRMFQQYGSCP